MIPPDPPAPEPITNGAALSPDYKAGAAVSIDINVDAYGDGIPGGDDIIVELPKFGLPSSIDDSDVLLDSKVEGGYSGNPSDVTVSGQKITIEVPTREGGTASSERANIPAGDYSIKIKQSAGITNPVAAGPQNIKVSGVGTMDEEFPVTIVHSVKLSEDSVTRGDDLTLTIKGFANGTATVYVTAGTGDKTEIGQTEVSGNVGEFAIDTSASAIKAGEDNKITVQDSKGADGGKEAYDSFTIKPKVTVDPESTTPSKDVTIKLSDWPAGRNIASVKIGGEDAAIKDEDDAETDSDGAAEFDVTVPSTVNTGTQTVTVTGEGKTDPPSASTTIGINVLVLTVSPSSAVPGQQITISGSGFAKNEAVDTLTIGGGEDNAVDPGDDASATSSGSVSVTVALPADIGSGDKKIVLTIDGREGEGEVTVPKPAIELDPAESVPGSVISVTGTGFASNQRVEASYKGGIEAIGSADSEGNVSLRLPIPSGAGVGATNEVKVKTRHSDTDNYGDLDISATAKHKTPGPAITVTPEAHAGGMITISGTNFEVFSALTVTVGGSEATLTPANPETDKNGAWCPSFQARVSPRLS